jgi:hypothetical protein
MTLNFKSFKTKLANGQSSGNNKSGWQLQSASSNIATVELVMKSCNHYNIW